MNHLQRHFSKNRAILCYDRPSQGKQGCTYGTGELGERREQEPALQIALQCPDQAGIQGAAPGECHLWKNTHSEGQPRDFAGYRIMNARH